ncbi:MAG: hypothetical protein ACOYYJ_18025 [Chloroflexota bacterium]
MAKALLITATILCAFELDGERYLPGQVVEFDATVANDLAELGQIDKHKDAVAYAKGQGAKVIRHPVKGAEAETQPEPPAPPSNNPEPAAVE